MSLQILCREVLKLTYNDHDEILLIIMANLTLLHKDTLTNVVQTRNFQLANQNWTTYVRL